MPDLCGECFECGRFQYNERIERKYGMGTGICSADNEPKGCNHKACLLFCIDQQNDKGDYNL